MELPAKAHQGDIVRCDVRGQRFWALVVGKVNGGGGKLMVEPLPGARPLTYTTITSQQVVGYWRKLGRSAI